MSCRPGCEDDFAGLLREARKAGVLVQLDRNGKLVMRASKKPPTALIDHLREHARKIAAYLERKSTAESAEARVTINAKAKVSGPAAGSIAIGFGMCDRCGKPPTKDNRLIGEGLSMIVHEKCYRGRGGQTSTYRPHEGGDRASLNQGTSSPVADLVPVRRKR